MIDWTSNQTRVELLELKATLEMYGKDSRVVRLARTYRKLRNKIWWDYRRRLLSYLRWAPPKDNRLHVYFHLRGGVGDCAANRVAINKLRELLPQAVFYFFTDTPHAADPLFVADDKHVFLDGKIPLWYRYDLAFEICLSFKTVHINRKRVTQLAPQLLPVLEKGLQRQKQLDFLVEDNYLMDEALGRFLAAHNESQLIAQSYLSGLDYDVNTTGLLAPGLLDPSILVPYHLTSKTYITIHSGINILINPTERTPLKCWPEEKWRTFVKLFKAKFPHIKVVQIGGKNSPKFDFVDVCLVGQTSLKQIPALMEHALLHVDGESGLAQLTRWIHTQAVVFFGPTLCSSFGLSKNCNLTANLCRPCMWLSRSWYFDCALGYPSCQNMEAISAAQVFQAVAEKLSSHGL